MSSLRSNSLRYDCLGVVLRYAPSTGELASGLLVPAVAGLLSLPEKEEPPPRKEGIGFESFLILLAALLFENARFTCVPPASTGCVAGAAAVEVEVVVIMLEADEEVEGVRALG